jgi:murein DD-endopeptidase MepM/ murein hydrolase activator NlpD
VRRIIAMTLMAVVIPAAADAQTFRTLEPGDRGSQVRLVQRALNELGIRTAVDGVYGSATARAVKRYERREDLPVDGAVSRGQARGMLKRADMDSSAVDEDGGASTARPRSAPQEGSGTFPVQGEWKQGDGFGERSGGHDGTDLMADCGTPLVAGEAGRVVFADAHESAGNYVVIRSAASGEDHVYMHMQGAAEASKGDEVQAGQRLGAVGRSGNATACHLHFEIWSAPGWHEGGAARDPAPDLQRWGGGS